MACRIKFGGNYDVTFQVALDKRVCNFKIVNLMRQGASYMGIGSRIHPRYTTKTNQKDNTMRKPQRGYARQDRVKEQIMRELAELVRTGLKDPRAGFITINDVEVTRDYSHATVHYTVLNDAQREVTEEALEHAKGFLRSELSKRIRVFRTPELHFVYDESLARGMNISQLIDKVSEEKPVED